LSAVQAAVGNGGLVIQAKWTEEQETQAQEKLAETDGSVVEVPAAHILNQQAWVKGARKCMAIKLPAKHGGGGRHCQAAGQRMRAAVRNPPHR